MLKEIIFRKYWRCSSLFVDFHDLSCLDLSSISRHIFVCLLSFVLNSVAAHPWLVLGLT